jgi:hypothetical protein
MTDAQVLHAGMALLYAGIKLVLAYGVVSIIVIGYQNISRKENKWMWLIVCLAFGSYLFFHSATYADYGTEAPDADAGQWGE